MKNFGAVILLLLCTSLAFQLLPKEGTAEPLLVAPALSSGSILLFKHISLDVKVVNSTYAQFKLSASVMNPSNRTLPYIIAVSISIGYERYYPFGTPLVPAKPQAEFGVEITSEKLGRLNMTVDMSTATALSSLEAESDDRIHLEGWMFLRQTRHLIWREYVEDFVSFSFGPVDGGPPIPSETDLEVRFSYPVEYSRTDEANYTVEIMNGYKLLTYSERFYGSYGLSFSLYKPRIPVTSLIVFSALWVLLIAVVLAVRRRHVKD